MIWREKVQLPCCAMLPEATDRCWEATGRDTRSMIQEQSAGAAPWITHNHTPARTVYSPQRASMTRAPRSRTEVPKSICLDHAS